MTSDAILAELRGLPGAPDTLRERVLALPEPQPRVRVVAAAARPPPRSRSSQRRRCSRSASAPLRSTACAPVDRAASSRRIDRTPPASTRELAPGVAHASDGAAFDACKALSPQALRALPPSSTRLNKYEAWLRVRVADDRLSSATTRAMQIARAYGGYVALVDMNTPGKQGTASLVLRVPVDACRGRGAQARQARRGQAQRVRIEDLTRQATFSAARSSRCRRRSRSSSASSPQAALAGRAASPAVPARRGEALARAEDEGARGHRARGNARHHLARVLDAAGHGCRAAPSGTPRAHGARRRRVPRPRARVDPLRGDRPRADRAARRRARLRRPRRPPSQRRATARAARRSC